MKISLGKIILAVAIFMAVRAQFSGDGISLFAGGDLGELWPLRVDYVQGPAIQEGKPVLLEFWATWCGPCVASMPHIAQIAQTYSGRLQVVGITDDSSKGLGDFLARHRITFPIAIDHEQKYFRALKVRGIPHSVLLDKGGSIVWQGSPGELTDSVIESALR